MCALPQPPQPPRRPASTPPPRPQLPAAYLALLDALSAAACHRSPGLAGVAASALADAAERFPALAPRLLAPLLAGLADVPYQAPEDVRPEAPPPALAAALRDAALGAVPSPPQPSAQLSEAERNGRVAGCVRALSECLPAWRLIGRQPGWTSALLHALLAGRRHNASEPQRALGELLLQYAARALHPPALRYDGAAYGDTVRPLLAALAQGGPLAAGGGATFRYTLVGSTLLLLLTPLRPGEAAAGGEGVEGEGCGVSLLRHWLGLLVADSPPLRQLALAGGRAWGAGGVCRRRHSSSSSSSSSSSHSSSSSSAAAVGGVALCPGACAAHEPCCALVTDPPPPPPQACSCR